jgi:hypothetical protein
MPRHNELEHKALQVVMDAGENGILQADLWRKLEASSREGSRVALKLERMGLIHRKEELFTGRWTYRIFANRHPSSIESVIELPCFLCQDIEKCVANSTVSPEACTKLTDWLLSDEKSGEDEAKV